MPELASAIWSESAIGGVPYRRFHCIGNTEDCTVIIIIIIIIIIITIIIKNNNNNNKN